MTQPQYTLISWADYHLMTQKLAAAILSHSGSFDQIIAISRGGLTLGHLLSDLLNLPLSTIAIQSYQDIQTQGDVRLIEKIHIPIQGKRILLVDDVSDTGKTLKRAQAHLKEFKPKELLTVCLFYKPTSIVRPDYYVKQTKKWIMFPYEPTEMIKRITQRMQQEKKTKVQIQDFLTKLGFREGQIAFTRKHHL